MSALRPPQSHHSGKHQWWSRPSASKGSTMPAYRAPDSSGTATPTTPTSTKSQTYEDKSLNKGPKQSIKRFNTLASVFKPKKSHPTINIPSGPVSPPLPFQNPPPPSAPNSGSGSSSSRSNEPHPPPRPPRSARPVTASSSSSYQYDPKSPGEPSIYTYPSSEENFEPMTPSDQLSRHRTSYQPSLFTFAEQQDHSAAALRLGDVSGSRYSPSDVRRISVLSDPSVIDPHMRREQGIRSSQVSASSYYPAHQSEHKSHPGKGHSVLRSHRDSLEGRKSSRDSFLSKESKEIDLTSDTDTNAPHIKPPEPRSRDQRHSDIPVPAVPKLSASMLLTAQRPALRQSPSETATAALRPPGSSSGSRRPSPAPSIQGQSDVRDGEGVEKDRVMRLPTNERSSRTPPAIRPKAASVSAGSLSGSSASAGGRPSPSINSSSSSSATPLSRNASVISGTGSAAGSMSNVVQRQQSISRLRTVPPSRIPPPSSNLPPTPQDNKPPSPLTFRSPKNLSNSSLLNSANSPSDDPSSILTFDLQPSSPSSEASSCSMSFAPSVQVSTLSDVESSVASPFRSSRNARGTNVSYAYRYDSPVHRSVTPGSHTAKSSWSSSNTLMGAFTTRGETPVQRSIRKSMSQSSLSLGSNGRGERPELSVTAGSLIPEENPASVLHSMRTLRKQRSMHNTRVLGGSLALPPLPQQLRHVSSFNASEVSGSGHSSHSKGDSGASPFGSQRRSANSGTPGSTAPNSIVNTPTTPSTHKKRSIFSSHGRDKDKDKDRERRDSNVESYGRDKHESASSAYSADGHHNNDKKKSHTIGLGLFSGHFSPSSSSSYVQDASDSRRPSSPTTTTESAQSFYPCSPSMRPVAPTNTDHITQHILPPKELLSQMEVLANMEAPSSPLQFSDRSLDDDYWDGSSIATGDKHSTRSRLDSLSGQSIASSVDENGRTLTKDARSSTASLTTRRFANASDSIHGILEKDRPSTSSRLPTRNVSGVSALSRTSTSSNNARPATADSFMGGFSLSNGVSGDGYCPPTGLPPPPRRKGAVVSSTTTRTPTPASDRNDPEEPQMSPLSPPPPRTGSASRLQRLPSVESQQTTRTGGGSGLQRLSSYETISTYNPNRVSIFRKPSFLNIEDEMNEQLAADEGKAPTTMTTVPEDSFLILDHGKDSLDLGSTSDEFVDGPFPHS